MSRKKLVVLTGAGISAESGLRTFRDSDGLWEGYDIEEVATPQAWRNNPELVIDFYNMRRRDVLNAIPNAAHDALASLEKYFDVSIITQNIDDLHERAGSTNVLHLHGRIFSMCSERDRNCSGEIRTDMQYGMLAPDGFAFRPDIVWFGEAVPMIEPAAELAATADIFLVVGTSLQVYPAAGLIQFVPEWADKFIVDKKIPPTQEQAGFREIEKPATEGMKELLRILVPGSSQEG